MWRRYGPGEIAPAGGYLRNGSWELMILADEGVLPGGQEVAFYRVPTLVLLLLAPLAGLAWLFVYPFVVPLTFGYAAWRRMLDSDSRPRKRESQGPASPPSHGDGLRAA